MANDFKGNHSFQRALPWIMYDLTVAEKQSVGLQRIINACLTIETFGFPVFVRYTVTSTFLRMGISLSNRNDQLPDIDITLYRDHMTILDITSRKPAIAQNILKQIYDTMETV